MSGLELKERLATLSIGERAELALYLIESLDSQRLNELHSLRSIVAGDSCRLPFLRRPIVMPSSLSDDANLREKALSKPSSF